MSWGYRILLAYTAGVLFIGGFVYKAMQVQTDLSEEHYYEQELKFDDFAISRNNGYKLNKEVKIQVRNAMLELIIDSNVVGSIQQATIQVYYPANKDFDKTIKLPTPLTGNTSFSTNKLHQGACLVRLKFIKGGAPYFIEQPLNISYE